MDLQSLQYQMWLAVKKHQVSRGRGSVLNKVCAKFRYWLSCYAWVYCCRSLGDTLLPQKITRLWLLSTCNVYELGFGVCMGLFHCFIMCLEAGMCTKWMCICACSFFPSCPPRNFSLPALSNKKRKVVMSPASNICHGAGITSVHTCH